MLWFDRVSFAYRAGSPVLDRLSFLLRDGDRMTVTGESGCGKSTLLSLAAGLRKPTGGRVLCNTKKIACVFQEPRLFPWMTVSDNLCAVLPHGADRRTVVSEMLAQVGLSGTESLYPSELSGGMRSRVALARGLLYRGDLYLLDEPFASLDAALRRRLTGLLLRHLEATGASAILVTHQPEDAKRFGGKRLEL